MRKAGDIHEIRSYLAEQMAEFWPAAHPHPKIIAKIESTEGLQNFEEILAVSDGWVGGWGGRWLYGSHDPTLLTILTPNCIASHR